MIFSRFKSRWQNQCFLTVIDLWLAKSIYLTSFDFVSFSRKITIFQIFLLFVKTREAIFLDVLGHFRTFFGPFWNHNVLVSFLFWFRNVVNSVLLSNSVVQKSTPRNTERKAVFSSVVADLMHCLFACKTSGERWRKSKLFVYVLQKDHSVIGAIYSPM